MPPPPERAPILAADPVRQVRELWKGLAPWRWPIPPRAFPPTTALVGGAVRDGLLGRLGERPDLDLVVPADAVRLARELAAGGRGSCVVLDRERSIARVVMRGWTIDLARLCGESLIADLSRRDFSINAIALPLQGELRGELDGERLLDPHGGLDDLAQRRLVAIREANLLEDPLRMLRGLRLASELDFRIPSPTWDWIVTHHGRIATVAGERVEAELQRLAKTPLGHRGLRQVLDLDLLRPWGVIGTGGAIHDAATAQLDRLTSPWAAHWGLTPEEEAWALPLARLALVLDGAAVGRLHGSRRLAQRCQELGRWRSRLIGQASGPPVSLDHLAEPERLALHRGLEHDLPALLLYLDRERAPDALRRWRDQEDPLFHPRPPLDGAMLQRRLGLTPGPLVGQLLDHLMRERAFRRLPCAGGGAAVAEAAVAEARHWLRGQAMGHD